MLKPCAFFQKIDFQNCRSLYLRSATKHCDVNEPLSLIRPHVPCNFLGFGNADHSRDVEGAIKVSQ